METNLILILSYRYGSSSLSLNKLVPSIVKCVSDPTPAVRDAAFNTLVEIYRHVGDKVRKDLETRGSVPSARWVEITRNLAIEIEMNFSDEIGRFDFWLWRGKLNWLASVEMIVIRRMQQEVLETDQFHNESAANVEILMSRALIHLPNGKLSQSAGPPKSTINSGTWRRVADENNNREPIPKKLVG